MCGVFDNSADLLGGCGAYLGFIGYFIVLDVLGFIHIA